MSDAIARSAVKNNGKELFIRGSNSGRVIGGTNGSSNFVSQVLPVLLEVSCREPWCILSSERLTMRNKVAFLRSMNVATLLRIR